MSDLILSDYDKRRCKMVLKSICRDDFVLTEYDLLEFRDFVLRNCYRDKPRLSDVQYFYRKYFNVRLLGV